MVSRTLFLGALATVLLLALGERAHGESLPDGEGPHALEATLDLWGALPAQDRALMARLYAHADFKAALPVLRQCVADAGPEAPGCALALARLDDLDSASTLQDALRAQPSPALAASAALALLRWNDLLSYSLFNKSLLEGKGAEAGGAALMEAVLTLHGAPWRLEYVLFAWRRAPSKTARLIAAARLAQIPGKFDRKLAKAILEDIEKGLDEALAAPAWDRQRRLQAQIAAWGLSRTRDCQNLWGRLGAHLDAHPDHQARAADLLAHVKPACFNQGRKLLDAHGLTAPPKRNPPKKGKLNLPHDPISPIPCADARAWIAGLGLRPNLWGARGMPPAFAQLAEQTLCRDDAVQLGWQPESILAFPKGPIIDPGPVPENAQTRQTVEPPNLYPDAFNRFNPPLKQPDWFPEHIKITIDDGPRPLLHQKLHQVLDAHQVKASFFMCGVNILYNDNRDPVLMKQALQNLVDKGHHIAYHSMNHVTKRREHLIMMSDKQLKDDVDLFRLVIKTLLGEDVAITYGRMPGGLGSLRAESRKAYHFAGLNAPVFWNAGPPSWGPRENIGVVRRHACKFKARKNDKDGVILLLHETANIEKEINAFLNTLKECP